VQEPFLECGALSAAFVFLQRQQHRDAKKKNKSGGQSAALQKEAVERFNSARLTI
jgi:hypothetical protein